MPQRQVSAAEDITTSTWIPWCDLNSLENPKGIGRIYQEYGMIGIQSWFNWWSLHSKKSMFSWISVEWEPYGIVNDTQYTGLGNMVALQLGIMNTNLVDFER